MQFYTKTTLWARSASNIIEAANEPDLDTDPERAQYVRSIPDALLFNGLLMQHYFISPEFLSKVNDFEIQGTDIWLATYPKSGMTWTAEILSLVCNDGNIDNVKDVYLPKRVKHFEMGSPTGPTGFLGPERLLSTHLPATHIPNQLKQLKCKVSVKVGRVLV